MTQIDAQKLGELAQAGRSEPLQPISGAKTVFHVENLSVRYSGNLALNRVSLDIVENSVTAFIGPSG